MTKQELFTSFLQELAPDDSIKTVLHYPHPFTRGGFIVIFADEKGDWLGKLSRVQRAKQRSASRHQLHCLTPETLFELSQPGIFSPPLIVNEFPHLPYTLASQGSCLWGEDCRQMVRPYPQPKHLLAGHIEGCFDYLRRYGILMSLVNKRYLELGNILLNEMHYLQSTALLQVGIWDVTMDNVATKFNDAFPGHEATELLRRSSLLQEQQNDQIDNDIHRIIFLFEKMLRSFRHDLDNR